MNQILKISKTVTVVILGLLLPWTAHPSTTSKQKGVLTGQVVLENQLPDSGIKIDQTTVIYVTGFEEPPPPEAAHLIQEKKVFDPPILVITQGQSVEVINQDEVKHNVFSISSSHPFDLGLTSPQENHKIKFMEAGIIDVYCNIHPEMINTILVLPNRAFTITNAQGHYRIENIPVGEFTVYAWHRLAKPDHKTVKITPGSETHIDWKLTLSTKPTPHLNKYGRPYQDRKKY